MQKESSRENKSVTLLTRVPGILPLQREFWVAIAKKVTGRERGPDAVVASLERGLSANGSISYNVNPFPGNMHETVHVVSGVKTLTWAIEQKRIGRIKKLIAGPALVIEPNEADKIILDPTIDLILFPGQWTKDFFASIYPELFLKIKVWPAGVVVPEHGATKNWPPKKVLIYSKPLNYCEVAGLTKEIKAFLDAQKITSQTITYNSYKKADYHESLDTSDIMIFLSGSESQGLALSEAWARNVPTLVWNPGEWRYKDFSWKDVHAAAPCLTPETGMFFADMKEFTGIFERLGATAFHPHKYCVQYLSDKVTTDHYLTLIQ